MSNLVEALYQRAPWRLRDLAVSVYGLYLDRKRFGGEFDALLAEAIGRTYLSREEAAEHRARLFAELVAPALRGVAAYSRKPSTLAELADLPTINKHAVRGNAAAFVNAGLPVRRRVAGHTSGTTGAGLKFWSTPFAQRRQWAYWWRYRTWHGIQPGEWCAVFGGRAIVPPDRTRPPFWHVNLGGKTLLFSQYHLAPERVPSYLEEIRRRRIRWIHGYPSVIALLAQVGIAHGLAGSVPIRWVTTGAENLLPFQREAIERMFGVKPRQHYGLAEGIAGISECPEGRLHVDEDFSHVEFIPHEGDPMRYAVVGTTLDNEAMPLLRYECGDIVELATDGACGCGRHGRVVKSIDGRREDYVVLSDGARVGRLDHLFKDAVEVVEAQVIQQAVGRAIIRVVRGRGYGPADEQAIRDEARRRFGERLTLEFEYVSALPRTRTGKLRLVINEMDAGRLDGTLN